MGRTCLRNGIVLSLLIILVLCVTDFVYLAVAKSPDFRILDHLYVTGEIHQNVVTIYKHGFTASLWSRDSILAGRKVHMTPMSPSVDTVVSTINQAVVDNPNLLLVFGPASAELTLAALPALKKNSLVAFGPLAMVLDGQKWEPHFYFFLIGATFSVHALLRHAVINLRVCRLGFMYTTNVSTGDHEYEHTVKLMHGMGRELCGVFRLDGRVSHTADDELFKKEWEAFAETRPQAVIIMGAPNSTTRSFLQQMMKDPRTNSAYFMAPAMLERLTLRLWEEAKAKGAPSFPGQVITTATYPALTDTRSAMINNYRSVMERYLSKSEQTLYDPAEVIPDGRKGGDAMLAGWVAGEVFFQAISEFNPLLGREGFISSLFSQRTYFIGDVAVGTFGGDISENFVKSGGVARCNQGATTAYVKQYLDEYTSDAVHEGDFSLPLQVCHGDNLTLFDSAAVVMVNYTDLGPTGVAALHCRVLFFSFPAASLDGVRIC